MMALFSSKPQLNIDKDRHEALYCSNTFVQSEGSRMLPSSLVHKSLEAGPNH